MKVRRIIRAIRHTLSGDQGSIVEAVAATVIVTVVGSMLAYGAVTNMRVVSTVTAQTERQNAVTTLVGERSDPTMWGTATAPKIQTLSLPSKATQNTKAALWTVPAANGVTYYASMPKTGTVASPDSCLVSTAFNGPNCVVADQFQALTVAQQLPGTIVRKDPSGNGTTGTVDSRVTTSDAIPQGTIIAAYVPTTGTTTWRYLVEAQDGFGNPSGDLRFVQNGSILGDVPTDGSMHNYFGTIVTKGTGTVTLVAADDPNVVSTVLIYAVGSGS